MNYIRNALIVFAVLLVALGVAVVATGDNDAGDTSAGESAIGQDAEPSYRVVGERVQGAECETLYLDVVMPDDAERVVEDLVDDYDGETDAVQAIVWERERDIESPDASPVGNLRASYSDCGEAATGLPAGEYEYE